MTESIPCQSGYVHCYQNENTYGDAHAVARIYVSEPYIENGSLYVNYKCDGAKFYAYRGITSWSQVTCNSGGCNGALIGSSGKFLLGTAPSTTQQGVAFVVWDYNSYGDYWAWTWVGFGWLQDFHFNLEIPGISCYDFMYPLITVKYRTEYTALKGGSPPDGGDVTWCCNNNIRTEAALRTFLKLDIPSATSITVTPAPAGYGLTHVATVVVTGTGTGTLVITNKTTGQELNRGTVTVGSYLRYFDLTPGTYEICAEVM